MKTIHKQILKLIADIRDAQRPGIAKRIEELREIQSEIEDAIGDLQFELENKQSY